MITHHPKNILVAKDSLFFRTNLSRVLTEAGHRVRLVEDGSRTMSAIESGTDIDLLIIDLLLPDMDGFTVLKWLSDGGYAGKFPVFAVIGAHESNLIVSNLFKYGASGVISKDFTPERIIFHINRALYPEKTVIHQSVRIPVSVPVDFSVGDAPTADTGFFLNISKSGAFLHTGAGLLQSAALSLRFGLPGIRNVLDTKGVVVWKTAGPFEGKPLFGGYGIRFTSVSSGDQAALDSYIDAEAGKLLVPLSAN